MKNQVSHSFSTVNLFGFKLFSDSLENISFDKKMVINTINAHSYNISLRDPEFHKALTHSDILLPDGAGIVMAQKMINNKVINKIAGYDVFNSILNTSLTKPIKCFFLGSSTTTLAKIKHRLNAEYPNIKFGSFSPPFKDEFSEEDNSVMRNAINKFKPDFLFVGMTAPKQEKWTFLNKDKLDVKVICNIGAVFDFYARTIKRAPKFLIDNNLEWAHRSFSSTRLMKRYLVSNPIFLYNMINEFRKKRDFQENSTLNSRKNTKTIPIKQEFGI